ncbi:hypothetical protein ACFFK0_02065 [Paenibacillus chartarius]|uniref:Post-SET domain-containing protein n=1 Tax=Paenibacillus chartarius TaxID=747481 RepID=A0ABV6DF10_9BACL
MLEWTYRNYSFDADLQIIHADVRIAVKGDVWVEEPLCIDVGLPALLLSVSDNTAPNRFADPASEWRSMPFLVCGCGDPECRGFSFAVEHRNGAPGSIRLMLLEERPGKEPRLLSEEEIGLEEWRAAILPIAEEYLQFVADLPYTPMQKDAVAIVRGLLKGAAAV